MSGSVTSSVLDEVIDCFLQHFRHLSDASCRRIAPRILANNSPIVRSILDCSSCITLFVLVTEYLAAHKMYPTASRTITTSDTRYALSVVISCCNSTCNMGPMPFIIRFNGTSNDVCCLYKVISIDIVNEPISIVINARLPVFLLLIDIEIIDQILMRNVYSTIYNGYNDIAFTRCILLPNR